MVEIINVITASLLMLSSHSVPLVSLLNTIAVIMALALVGYMLWKGKP